jgi:Tol biopolymer transport system component
MTRLTSIIASAIIAAGLSTLGAQTPTPTDRLFASAQYKENIDGDLKGAISDYKQVVAAAGANHALAAQALSRMAACYEKLGDPQAQKVYEQIARDYADQKEAVATAQAHIDAARPARDALFASQAIDQFLRGQYSFGTAIAPDGNFAAISLMSGGGPQTKHTLVIRSLQTGQDQVLALLPGPVQSIRFSPDGRRVAVNTVAFLGRRAEDITREELVVADLTQGSGSPLVVPGLSYARADVAKLEAQDNPWMVRMSWSADSNQLAYLVPGPAPHTFDCRVLNAATGESRSFGIVVEAKPDFRWSTRGELAIHVTNAARGTDDLRVLTPSTGRQETIPLPTGGDFTTSLAKWTAAGAIAVVQAATGGGAERSPATEFLLDVNSRTFTKTCVGNGPYRMEGKPIYWLNKGGGPDQCLQITQDGKSQIIWKSASKRLVIHDIGSGAEHNLTVGSGEEDYGILSPDDQTVVFVSDRAGAWGLYAAPLANAPVKNPALLAELSGFPRHLGLHWTKDGIVADWNTTERNVLRIDMDPATGHAVGPLDRLTQDSPQNFTPSISPDNRHIAYYSARGAKNGLAIMDADGTNERLVSEFQMTPYPAKPAWRSNEEVIVARPTGPGTNVVDVVGVNINSGAAKVLLPRIDAELFDGEYLSTTDEIVYSPRQPRPAAPPIGPASAPVNVVRAISLSNGRERDLLRMEGAEGTLLYFRVAPDGRRVAYVLQKDSQNMNSCELGVLSIDDGHRTVLATNRSVDMEVTAWSPDSRFLLYGNSAPRVFDLMAGSPAALASWPVLTPPDQVPDWMPGSGSWSPNGLFIVLSQSSLRGEWRQWHGVTAETVVKATKGGGR